MLFRIVIKIPHSYISNFNLKQFLKKIVALILLFICYNCLNLVINFWFIRTQKFLKKNILVVGDSQFMTGIDDNLFYSAWNISQPAEPLPLSYWKIKKLTTTSSYDTILVNISHQRISFFNEIKFGHKKYKDEFNNRMYPFINDVRISKLNFNGLDFIKKFYQQMCLFPKLNHKTFIGEFSRAPNNSFLKKPYDNKKLETRINDHFCDSRNESYSVSNISLNYIDSIITFTSSKKITPIFISLPVHEKYISKVPEGIKSAFESLSSKLKLNDIKFLDYTTLKISDSLFLDFDHINKDGSKLITRRIIEDLKLLK